MRTLRSISWRPTVADHVALTPPAIGRSDHPRTFRASSSKACGSSEDGSSISSAVRRMRSPGPGMRCKAFPKRAASSINPFPVTTCLASHLRIVHRSSAFDHGELLDGAPPHVGLRRGTEQAHGDSKETIETLISRDLSDAPCDPSTHGALSLTSCRAEQDACQLRDIRMDLLQRGFRFMLNGFG